MTQKRFNYFSWGLVVFAAAIPLLTWLQIREFSLSGLSAFSVFPLLGMWAWFLMWTHYITGALRAKYNLAKAPHYSKSTGTAVLGLILLHPLILIVKQNQLGLGLPPKSTLEYVGEAQKVALYSGILALTVFLSFEIFRRIRNNPIISRNWQWVSVSQAVAMYLIFFHGLRLGQHLGAGWMRVVWAIAGLVLLPCVGYLLNKDFAKASQDAAAE